MSLSTGITPGTAQENIIEPFKVFIRIRPLSEKEKIMNEKMTGGKNNLKHIHNPGLKNILVVEENLLFVLDPDSLDYNGKKEKSFAFDNVFTEKHSNNDIFCHVIKNMVDNVMRGYNATAFAYGVTGTGKTHTVFGDMSDLYGLSEDNDPSPYSEKGVCLLALDYLFEQIAENDQKTFSVKISYLEIYNEQVIDLLVSKPTSLMIVEDSGKGVVVPDLTEYSVSNSRDLVKLIIEGNSRRTMASTTQNQFSSRSHAILQVIVEQKSRTRTTKEEMLVSKFLVVDLAGSERGGLEKGLRTQEGANINKSLLSLGNCINILSDKSKKGAFVPYRDSKLTRLLKDSLGGNISTVMIACVSPSPISYDETVNTLKYATRARTIQKKITKNVKEVDVHISQYKDIIDSLKSEIDQLKEIIKNQQNVINDRFQIGENNTSNIISNNAPNINPDGENKNTKNEIFFSNSQSTPKLQTVKLESEKVKLESSVVNNDHADRREKNKSNANVNPSFNNPLSKSTIMNNKNGNYSNISMVSKRSTLSQGYAQRAARTAQNINLDPYKKFLDNAGALNVESMLQVDDGNNAANNPDDLEKQIDNLQHDKILLEEFMEKSKVLDKSVSEKYKLIKSYYQKYLELINDKLIENIEQNMILKFNMKEILDLNNTNNQHLSILYSQIILMEKNNLSDEDCEVEEQIKGHKEEMKNIQAAIEENERIKDRISESLKRNLKIKKMLKKILVKLISNSSYNNKDQSQNEKFEQAYKSLVKEKQDLEMKNMKFKKYLGEVMKEREKKDEKLTEVEKELEKLKRELNEKNRKIREFENETNSKRINTKQSSEDAVNILITNNDYEGENVMNTYQSEVENIDLNLQEDYFNDNNKKFIIDIDGQTPPVKKKNTTITANPNNFLTNEDKEQPNTTINNIQSIKYIINQTNNIVNNNINKIINKEKQEVEVKNPVTTNKSANVNENKGRPLTKSMSKKRNTISTNATPNNRPVKRVSAINNSEVRMRSQSKSPRSSKKSKLKEFDKIIESQLNEVYNKKAKEVGERMKRRMSGKSSSSNLVNANVNKKDTFGMNLNDNENHFNMILDKFNRMIEFTPPVNSNNFKDQNQNYTANINNHQQMNRSLSISCVSINQEGDFNSELDIALNIPAHNNNQQNFRKEPHPSYSNNAIFNNIPDDLGSKIALNSHTRKLNTQNPHSAQSSANKQINVQKFLNNNSNSDSHTPNLFLNNLQKDKPVAINNAVNWNNINNNPASKRDHSPGVSNLRQARLEKQLRNQTMDSNNNQSQSNLQNVSNNSQIQNVNKFISKNTVDFLNDYLNNKKSMVKTESSDDVVAQNLALSSNRTVLPKNEVFEAAMSSLMVNEDTDRNDNEKKDIQINQDTQREEENKELEGDPDLNSQNSEQFFKSLNDVIRNPKVSRFLDKK